MCHSDADAPRLHLQDRENVYIVMDACGEWDLGRLLAHRGFVAEDYAAWIIRHETDTVQP